MLDQTTPTMATNQIKIGKRSRVDLGDIDALARDIGAVGLLQPIVVTPAGELIAGFRRLAAWKLIKDGTPIPVHVVDLNAIVRGEWSENVFRKAFSPSEAVAIARRVEPMIRQAAKERMTAGVKQEKGGCTRDILASHCGFSGKTLEKAIRVIDAAARRPGAFDEIVRRMDATGNVDAAHRAIVSKRVDRALAAPSIFSTVRIGNARLADLSLPEVRWLIGFFAEIDKRLPQATSDAADLAHVLRASDIHAAVKHADRARKRD